MTEAMDADKAAPIFDGWQETMIWSCLQGVMGKVYVDASDAPETAMAFVGDFAFYGGKESLEALRLRPEGFREDLMILVPQTEGWGRLIGEYWGKSARRITRYAIKKEPDVFDRAKLERAAAGLPAGYLLAEIDEALFHRCGETPWCRDFVAQFDSYARYREYGLGVVALKEGEIVSGASSYTAYREGIEVEIDTKEGYRRRGLAYACGAKLILLCLERGRYPSWDVHNKESVALAEKLGYHYSHAYTAYEVTGR